MISFDARSPTLLGVYVRVFVFDTRAELRRAYVLARGEPTMNLGGFTVTNDDDIKDPACLAYVALTRATTLDVVAHEVLHVVWSRKWTDEEDAANAQGHLTANIWRRLQRYR